MTTLLIPGALGLLLGLILHWTRLSHPWQRPRAVFLSGMTALGWTLLLASILTWLAVLPLSTPIQLTWRLLRFSGLYALSAWACGFAPLTALAGFKFRPVEALCVLLGCGVGSLMRGEFSAIHLPVENFLATLPGLPLWLGGVCVVVGMLGVIIWRKKLRG